MAKSTCRAKPEWLGVAEAFRALCIGMDTPRSLKAAMLLKYGELEQLVSMKIHPSEYMTASSFAGDYAIASFLKKNPDMPLVANRKGAAVTAFESSEASCRSTNELLEAWMDGSLSLSRPVVRVIHLAQRKISRLLAVRPRLDEGPYSWGPGATFDLRRSEAYPDTKIVELPLSVTGSAWKHASKMINSDLHWKEAIIRDNSDYKGAIFMIVPGGRYDTVPKTVLTDRSILVEPRLNTVLQKRIGLQLRDLLMRVGVDLNDQSRNQELARSARDLGLATLDLEAASDSISRKVVQLLLPPDWFELLDDIRSKWVLKEGTWVRLEKFSSMGNGFTFELESLIFWALASAASELCNRSTVGIYGDDVIVYRGVVPLLVSTFTVLGFRLNSSKSFVTGEFFESCGKHFYGGVEVTPAYQKCSPKTPYEAARMGNRLLRLAARLGLLTTLDERVQGAWESWFRRWSPEPVRVGPLLLGAAWDKYDDDDDKEGNGFWEAPANHRYLRARVGPFGPWRQVACYSPSKVEIPQFDEAMYAVWLMQTGPLVRAAPIVGVDLVKALSALSRIDSVVSLTGTAQKTRLTYSDAEPGWIPSRIKPRYVTQHRRVFYGPCSTTLDW